MPKKAVIPLREASKKLEEYRHSKPEQLQLFEMLLPEDKPYSNTIEFYDFIPKYHWGKVERINGKFLDSLERNFECKGQTYKVKISPAGVEDKDGVERYYYPSKREELVEDALRKLAVEGQGMFLDELAGVSFTLYQLQQELKKNGHSYSLDQIKESLQICNQAHLSLKDSDGKSVFAETMFVTLGLQTREDWKGTGQKTRAFVRFNSLVSKAIQQKMFRQINYEISMSYKTVIARQLHKRMSHHYTQASYTDSYGILLSTIIRDFGLTEYAQLRDNMRKVETSLKEMDSKNVIMAYKAEKISDAQNRNKLVDVKFIITPSFDFIKEMKRANKRQNDIKQLS